jgi:Lipocalin-like domain
MKRIYLTFVAASLLLCLATWPVKSADNSTPVVGTWRVTSYSTMVVESGEVSRPMGEHPVGYIQYSPGGHMIVFLAKGELPKPASLPYSDAERAEIHKGIFGAYAGRYSVEGNKVIHHVKASWLTHWIGGDQIRFFEINGNKLTIRTAPAINNRSGKTQMSTLTFERAE